LAQVERSWPKAAVVFAPTMLDERNWFIIFNSLPIVAIIWRVFVDLQDGILPRWSSDWAAIRAALKRVFITPADPLHRQLKDMAGRRLTEQVTWGGPWILLCCFSYNIGRILENDISKRSLFVNMGITVLFMVATVKPRWVTPTVMTGTQLIYYSALVVVAITANDSAAFVEAASIRIFLRFILGVADAKPRLTLLLGIVYVAATPWYSTQEVFTSFFIFAATTIVTRSRDAEFLATLQAKSSQNIESAARGLLSSVCDAVVRLSKDLQILEQSRHLASLLLRSPNDMSVGVSFADLAFDASETERLIRFLERPISDACTLHVSFMDAWGMPVKFQLFHAWGVDTDNEPIHMVGVKDDSEEPRAPPEGVLRESFVARSSKPRELDIIPEDAVSVSGSSSSSGLLTDTPCTGMFVYLDPEAAGLRVLQGSPEFLSLSGPVCEGAELLKWVINDADFLNWLQGAHRNLTAAHKQSEGQNDIELESHTFPVRLKLPHMGSGVRQVRANARLRLDVSQLEVDPEANPRLLLMLNDVHYVAKRQRAPPRGPPRRVLVL